MSPVPSSTTSAADRRTESPSGPQDSASPDPANAGRLVTSIEDLVGVWQAVQLGGSDVASVRDPAGNPLTVRFSNGGRAGFAWTANDGCNTFSGNVSIRSHGQFQAEDGVVTLVGCLPADRILYPRNPAVVVEADQALISPAGSLPIRMLTLLRNGEVLAAYREVRDEPGQL